MLNIDLTFLAEMKTQTYSLYLQKLVMFLYMATIWLYANYDCMSVKLGTF